MPKPVKDEIFGSRKSILKDKLKISLFENIFFATCLHRINPDPATRYIMLRECASANEYKDTNFTELLPFFKSTLTAGNILLDREKIQIKNLRSGTSRVFYRKEQFAVFLLKVLKCHRGEPLAASTAKVIENEEVSPLSRFLRTDLYGRVGSTDIDFMILNAEKDRLTLVEEKLYTRENGGSIGHGQYLSFRELLNDVFSEEKRSSIRFYLLFFSGEDNRQCYVYNFLKEHGKPARAPSFFDPRRKEQRILFPFSEMKSLTAGEFLGTYIFG